MRRKWDERSGSQTHGDLTIARTIESCTEGYTARTGAASSASRAESIAANRLLDAADGFPDDELEDAVDIAQRP